MWCHVLRASHLQGLRIDSVIDCWPTGSENSVYRHIIRSIARVDPCWSAVDGASLRTHQAHQAMNSMVKCITKLTKSMQSMHVYASCRNSIYITSWNGTLSTLSLIIFMCDQQLSSWFQVQLSMYCHCQHLPASFKVNVTTMRSFNAVGSVTSRDVNVGGACARLEDFCQRVTFSKPCNAYVCSWKENNCLHRHHTSFYFQDWLCSNILKSKTKIKTCKTA